MVVDVFAVPFLTTLLPWESHNPGALIFSESCIAFVFHAPSRTGYIRQS